MDVTERDDALVEIGGSRLVLVAALWASLMVMASTSAVTTLVVDIARDLEASQSQIQWIVDAYPLVLGALLLPAGALLDRFGRKRGMVGGLAILSGAMLWSGLASGAGELIASRCVAGLGAALVFPGTLATITSVTPPAGRGRAVGLWASTTIFGGMVGVLLSGGFVELAWWGSAFLATAALVATCLSSPWRWCPRHAIPSTPTSTRSGRCSRSSPWVP